MKRRRFGTFEISMVALVVALCLPAGGTGAEDGLIWPVQTKQAYNDGDVAPIWHDVGDVSIWNTSDELKIDLVASEGLQIEEIAIHIVQDPADFDAILDKYGKPKVSKFTYKTDYLGDEGIRVASHREVVNLDDFEICWGVNPDQCPPNLYIIVAATLARWTVLVDGEEAWVQVPETTYAQNGGMFDRYPGSGDDGIVWGWYVTYPLAKAQAGHFVDANVNGGTTGDNGQFWWLPDESIDFSVGSLDLGNALADRAVSPVDLFPGSDMDDPRVVNMAWLLQSLDTDGNAAQGAINITDVSVACLESALGALGLESVDFGDVQMVGALIEATRAGCAVELPTLTRDEAWENLATGQKAGNLMKKNVSKNPGMQADKAKIEIMPVYVPALRSDGTATEVTYYDADDVLIETRNVAKPIVVAYVEEVESTGGAMDVFVAISRDDGETWKRRNISRTADKSSLLGYPGESFKPMLKVKDNMIFLAWTDKYCRGGRPGYAINLCDDPATEVVETPETGCAVYCTGNPPEGTYVCTEDYPGDDAYWQDDLYGVGGPQRTVIYEDYPEMGEVPYSCVWTARGTINPATGDIQWFKPERVSSGRRDANQLFAGAGDGVAFAIVWQEDPKGLMPGDGDGPGEGWSGANTNSKTDIWFSYITEQDFATIDDAYPTAYHGDGDFVDTDPELAGRVKALVPMSLPIKISDNDMCSLENMDPAGGDGDHIFDEEGEGTHRYCGTLEGIGTAGEPGSNPLCAYTFEKLNHNDELHHVCVTADGRLLDGNTGASRPNVFVQPYMRPDGTKSAWVMIGYEESKGVGTPPEEEGEEREDGVYKPDMGKNVIYHSFELFQPKTVDGGGIINLPETDASGNPVYLVDEFGELIYDWNGQPILAYENARRVRFIPQPKSKAGASKTVLVALYRQGEEGSGKPADVFMRRIKAPSSGNPYAFGNFVAGAQNLSSVTPTVMFQDPFDPEKPNKMLRWAWTPANLADSSAKTPYSDALAHRGALNGDELIIAYSWTPNWGRNANDKYDLYVRRSFNGGQSWTTDPLDSESITHNVAFRVPVIDEENQVVTWDEEIVSTTYGPGASEPPRNVSNLRNMRISVLEPRLVKTPGTIKDANGYPTGYPEDIQDTSVYQVAYGIEFNQNQAPNDVVFPKMPLDIYYGQTLDKGQRYETVIVTPQGGSGGAQEGWNLLAKDQPEQGAAQLRQTPDGSRMYAIWVENSDQGSDIMFRRVDYRGNNE